MMNTTALSGEAYPLYWPEGWPRTRARRNAPYRVTFATARDELSGSLRLMGGKQVVVSTNIPIRRDQLPMAHYSEPADPGVAVYWVADDVQRVIACDQWRKVKDNVRAAGLAVEALRTIQRSGASQILERAFVGLTALAASNPVRTWRDVFGFEAGRVYTPGEIHAMYKALVHVRHPDRGGSHDSMTELNEAYRVALQEMNR